MKTIPWFDEKEKFRVLTENPIHLIVLCHGNNQNERDWDTVVKVFKEVYGDEVIINYGKKDYKYINTDENTPTNPSVSINIANNLNSINNTNSTKKKPVWYILVSSSNGHKTRVGVEVGGDKLSNEILNYIRNNHSDGKGFSTQLNQEEYYYSKAIQLYMIGHSLGGLFMRSAIGKLNDSREWKTNILNPCSFNTICTPHLGVHFDMSFKYSIYNYLKSNLASEYLERLRQTGQDLDLKSITLDNLSEGIYAESLRKFQFRTVFSLTSGDTVVPFSTSNINSIYNYSNVAHDNKNVCYTFHGFSGFTESRYIKLLTKSKRYKPPHSLTSDSFSSTDSSNIIRSIENRKTKDDTFILDDENILLIKKDMLLKLNAIGWRRVDFSFFDGNYLDRLMKHGTMLGMRKNFKIFKTIKKYLKDYDIESYAKKFIKSAILKLLIIDRVHSTNFMRKTIYPEVNYKLFKHYSNEEVPFSDLLIQFTSNQDE